MNKCKICPRKCGVDRNKTMGFCGEQSMRVSLVMFHKWEEPIISGSETDVGSGTIFFTGCNLKCVYCQNHEISRNGAGSITSPEQLVDIIKKLESQGALNINFVTPTHFASEIIKALKIYKPKIPIVWNTSGYENVETIKSLSGLVDIFLTDIKYYSGDLSKKYSSAENYFEKCSKAVKKMREVVGDDLIEDGIMKKGLIVRHMILPENTDDSVKILEWVKENLGIKTILSIMNQYVPVANACEHVEINRKVKQIEYKRVVKKAIDLGFVNAFTQDDASASTEYIPNFSPKNSI